MHQISVIIYVLNGTIKAFLPADRLWNKEYDDKNNEDVDIDELKYALGLCDDIESSQD